MSLLRSYLLLLFVSLLTLNQPLATAADNEAWYDVELLIFSQSSERALRDETWPEENSVADLDEAIELEEPQKAGVAQPVPFQHLSAEQFQLSKEAERLTRSKNQELLMHLAWRQPGLPSEEAKAIRIRGNKLLDWEEAPPIIDGTVKLILSRYLHLHVDLLYNRIIEGECPKEAVVEEEVAISNIVTVTDLLPPEPEGRSGPCYLTLHLKEARRMRSKEIHYLDHPFFGIVVLVTPYEPPKQVEDEPADAIPVEEKPATDKGTAAKPKQQ